MEDDVAMGGMEALEMVKVNAHPPSGSRSGEGGKSNEPLPQIVSDIVGPGRQEAPGTSTSTHDQGMQQAASLAAHAIKQGFTLQSQTPPRLANTRLTVLIKSSPPASHLSLTSKMKKGTASTAASGRDQRVKVGPQNAAALPSASQAVAPRKIAGQSPQGRPRGRPKGWKPGMTYAALRGEPPAPSSSEAKKRPVPTPGGGEPKRRGRPPRAPDASAREQYLRSNPSFTRFCCEWMLDREQLASGEWRKETRCQAELQNMETLRQHVYRVHEPWETPYFCRWGKCGEKNPGVEFPDQEAFREHVETEHFRSFAWHMGDGVQNKGISTLRQDPDELPTYLFKDGVQVTPSIRDQRLEDEQRYRERRRKLRKLLIQKDENAPDEEEFRLQTLGLAQAQLQLEGRFQSRN